MWIVILLILIVGALTGTLGEILEVAAGVVVGLVLFVVGVALAAFYYMRHLYRRAVRERDGDSREDRSQGWEGGPEVHWRNPLPPGERDGP